MGVWNLKRGFLPSKDPLQPLRTNGWRQLEFLAENLARWNDEGRVREELIHGLRQKTAGKLDVDSEAGWERLMMLYSYFASIYIHSKGDKTATRLPQEIAKPLMDLSKEVGRRPILSYANYCLTNWRRLNPKGKIELGNIELLQNSTLEAKRDEDWFILVHVDIEARGEVAITALRRFLKNKDVDRFCAITYLSEIHRSLKHMCRTLRRMPEQCSTEVYYDKVRPFIWGFENVIYEPDFGVMSHRGETGAQSSLIPAIQVGLGIAHQDSMLTRHLGDMRQYMPQPHQKFLTKLEKKRENKESLRDLAQKYGLKEPYNLCVEGLAEFRNIHLGYAIDYIKNKTDNPTGTGGTPFIPWLSKLAEETKSFLL